MRKDLFTDKLTNLYTEEYFLELLEREVIRAIRYQRPLSLLLVDIDFQYFIPEKELNIKANFLYPVLKHISYILKDETRIVDIAGRFGGHQLAALLPETDLEGALIMAERLREYIEKTPIKENDKEFKVAVSVGVASYFRHAYDSSSLIKLAKLALKEAKNKGGNCVEVSTFS